MVELHTFYYFLDLAGTFAFAISGATAARQRGLDLFGICAVAFTVACGGGITRDLCIGAIPPEGISNWLYLSTAMVAAIMTIWLYPIVQKIKTGHPFRCSRNSFVCRYRRTKSTGLWPQCRSSHPLRNCDSRGWRNIA
jgi:hypothetical protein